MAHSGATPTIGIIGVGQLAAHLVEGFCGAERPPKILLSPRSKDRAQALSSRFSLQIAADNQAVVDGAGLIILSVPPGNAVDVAASLDFKASHVVVCVAAGVNLEPVAQAASPAATVRAMPVTSAAVRESATVLYPDHAAARAALAHLGTVHTFDTEAQFEIAMVIATYYGWVFALMAEAADWLAEHDIDPAEAKRLVAQMTRGVCAMCMEGAKDMASEGREIGRAGTFTGMGLDKLERIDALSAWRETLEAVLEATRRGRAD
jgi:pyrroline-5-carboxylate reductase